MKKFILIGICLFLFITVAEAETMYVSDRMKVTLRTGPGVDRKIVAMIESDDLVEILKTDTGKGWTLVRIPNGKEGWVISRFLTSKQPSRILLERLKKKHEDLTIRSSALLKENAALKAEKKRLDTELANNKKTLNELSKSYEILKTESADFIKLKSSYLKSTSQLAEQTKKAEKLEGELTKLKWNQNIRWFLSGAGVLILGFIIGLSIKRQRRRSTLL